MVSGRGVTMLIEVRCDCCGKRACEVENIVVLEKAAICNHCVGFAARKIGLLPPQFVPECDEDIEICDPLHVTFKYAFEFEGHLDQKCDVLVLQSLLDRLRSKYWDIAFELARITRLDGFVRRDVADGAARYEVTLVVRAMPGFTREKLRILLEDELSSLACSNSVLLHDKGTRDLLEPRLASLSAYVVDRAARLDLHPPEGL